MFKRFMKNKYKRDEYYTDWHEKNEKNREEMYGRRYGRRYNEHLDKKEVAKIIRKYIKETYPEFDFSVSSSRGESIRIYLTGAPDDVQIYSDIYLQTNLPGSNISWSNLTWKYNMGEVVLNKYHINGKNKLTKYSQRIEYMLKDIDNFGNSFRYDGTDISIDYFDTNFYVFTDIHWQFDNDRLEYELERFT